MKGQSADCDPPGRTTLPGVKVEQLIDLDTLFLRPYRIKADEVPDLITLQAQLDMLQEQLEDHYHKLKRFKRRTGLPIFP